MLEQTAKWSETCSCNQIAQRLAGNIQRLAGNIQRLASTTQRLTGYMQRQMHQYGNAWFPMETAPLHAEQGTPAQGKELQAWTPPQCSEASPSMPMAATTYSH